MALPNFDELQRLHFEKTQRAMALYPPGLNAMQNQRSPLEYALEQVTAANKENDALRRDIQSLRADLQQMLEADARRHEADREQDSQRRQLVAHMLKMFEAFETTVRDLATVMNGIPTVNSAYMHPAAASMYHSLSTITQSIHALRAIFFTTR